MNETEQRILNAAMKVFSEDGFEGARTRKIAELAGVNEVTLFRKFQSKENILRVVMMKNRDIVLQALDTVFLNENRANFQVNLHSLCENIMKIIEERIDMMIILIAESRKKPEIAGILAPVPEMILMRLTDYFEQQQKQGKMRNVNPRVAALDCISYFFYSNLLRRMLRDNNSSGSKEEFEAFIDVFLNGIESKDKNMNG
ncbi:HTH-type transcriptional regulator RutR [Methanosarcinales archaeon]|nr:TetR/AcrR family transcriptional regulator [Candidatus Methanoperedens sp. BLZ2]KAB2941305.1 MAG: TetR/AcrR family transcriptional regulator [Candidatus Methanoperedens sp.]MBZ0174117.1 TetR/AcrR family transcriptional regulator [Candidatus Methanoperedens nitroreducens]MCX9079598.1 TetR/AcrR family transcriptional regulator [Candidatus Methanoperedens sp.]CAG0990142.1 HTH-type transcriptional regulator RutR [Methanosarcinales archaeon]